MNAGLIVVGLLVAVLLVLVVRLLRPGGGVYINEKQANAMRSLHEHDRAHAERQRRN